MFSFLKPHLLAMKDSFCLAIQFVWHIPLNLVKILKSLSYMHQSRPTDRIMFEYHVNNFTWNFNFTFQYFDSKNVKFSNVYSGNSGLALSSLSVGYTNEVKGLTQNEFCELDQGKKTLFTVLILVFFFLLRWFISAGLDWDYLNKFFHAFSANTNFIES